MEAFFKLHIVRLAAFGLAILPAFTCGAWEYHAEGENPGNWVPQGETPAVQTSGTSLAFPIRFNGPEPDRMFWDLNVQANLSGAASLELRLSLDQPGLLRSLMVYLKSGDGWYLAGEKDLKTGRQTLSFPRSAFSTEGSPSGWNRIEAVRIACWRAGDGEDQLLLHGIAARGSDLVLVQGTASAPPGPERNFSRRVTERMSRWLSDLHIAHKVITDEDVEGGHLRHTDLAVFCYNPTPSAAALKEIRAFLDRGGKALVFYSSSEALAALMGFRLGKYKKSEHAGDWASFRFQDTSTYRVPERIYQDSTNIRPVYPASDSASVLAWWHDRLGQRTKDPAWTASPSGAWMSHIPLEGDTSNKKQMLLGLLAAWKPSLWEPAARRLVQHAGQVASFSSLDSAVEWMTTHAEEGQNGKHVRDLLGSAKTIRALQQQAYQNGNYASVVELDRKLLQTLTEAYGLVQPATQGEIRGVWEHDGTGWFPGNWEKTCALLEQNGINTLYANMLWGGLAHFKSTVLPRSTTYRQYGDQLTQCIKASRNHGLKVHLWKVCWNLQGAPDSFQDRMAKEGRLQKEASGRVLPWLCPSHPENQRMAIDSLIEAVRHYDVDGIHLDYIRFPEKETCFCTTCRDRFASWLGAPLEDWPASARRGGSRHDAFLQFRQDQVSLFVKGVHRQVRPLKDNLVISAAVFSSYPSCAERVAQDWARWIKEGWLDYAVPMNYTPSGPAFEKMLSEQLGMDPSFRRKIIPGLGVSSNESEHRPDQTIEQIRISRELGCRGFVLFDLSQHLKDEVLPALGAGPLRD